jgi:hypothetical protein
MVAVNEGEDGVYELAKDIVAGLSAKADAALLLLLSTQQPFLYQLHIFFFFYKLTIKNKEI